MNWDTWLETWRIHAATSAFRRRLARAVEVARRGAEIGKMFCALSGGKDGCALAAVIAEAGLAADVPMVHCHTELNTPGMLECAQSCAEQLDLDLDIVEPQGDVWELLRSLPRDIPIWDERNHLPMRNAISAGNMLVAHLYDGQYRGSFSGMRAEESRGRRMNRRIRGPLYQLKSDGTWMCLPIVDWSARDVFAMLVKHGLDIHPHYRRMLEHFRVSPESPQSRVDCMIPEERVTQWPIGYQTKMLYPDLWRRLIAARPEMALQGG